MLSGGPLKDTYVFEQLHFHWGENDFEGSEDLINNHSFPMEMHAVFYKEDYKSFKEALNYSDGLAILAYLYEVRNYLYLKILIGIFITKLKLIFFYHCNFTILHTYLIFNNKIIFNNEIT